MTQKNYEAIAEVLREVKALQFGTGCNRDQSIAEDVTDEITERLMDLFRNANPRFDSKRFHEAVNADHLEIEGLQ